MSSVSFECEVEGRSPGEEGEEDEGGTKGSSVTTSEEVGGEKGVSVAP